MSTSSVLDAIAGLDHHDRDEPGPAVRHLETALRDPGSLGDFDVPMLRVALALDRVKVGRYDGAAEQLATVVDDDTASDHLRATALRISAVLTWKLTADLGRSTELLERAAVTAGRQPGTGLWWHDGSYRGQFLLEADRVDEAVSMLRHTIDQQRAETCPDGAAAADEGARADLAVVLASLAQAEVRVGAVDDAVDHVEEAAELLPHQLRYALAYQLVALGEVSAARGDHPISVLALEEAERIALDLELLPALVWVHRARGRVERDLGDPVRARMELERATTMAEGLGHVAELATLRRELDAL